MKATASTSLRRNRLLIPINLSLRVTGAFYAAYGLAALAKLWQYEQSGHRSDANLFAGLILASFVAFGLILVLSSETFGVDLLSKRFSYRKGIWPFIKAHEGQTTEILAIRIHRFERVQSDGESGNTSSSPILSVRIEWKDGRPSIELFNGPEEPTLFLRNGRDRIVARAGSLADQIGCTLMES